MRKMISGLQKVMLIAVLGVCFYPYCCTAERAVMPPEYEIQFDTIQQPQTLQFTDEDIFILFDEDNERVNMDDIVCDSGKLVSLHKHKIYCLKCFGCDPHKHRDCNSRCKCKHPRLR